MLMMLPFTQISLDYARLVSEVITRVLKNGPNSREAPLAPAPYPSSKRVSAFYQDPTSHMTT